MTGIKLSILTNMVAPYRVPFFRELAANNKISRLRILTCVERESDRQWSVDNADTYQVKSLAGLTINLKRGSDAIRILHFRFGIFWDLLRHRPDCLIIGDASWTSYLAVLACKFLFIRYFVWNEITTTSRVSKGFVSSLRRWMYRGADKLIASCQMAKEYLLQNGVSSDKVHIVLNAVDNDFFLAQRKQWEPQRAELRAELGIKDDAFCFIYVGQLISRKRVLETIELLAKVALHRAVHLVVVGSGPLESQMCLKARELEFESINFCGYSNPERLSQLYVASDALILLSEDEPWGMVVNESLLFGKPIFVSKNVAAGVEMLRFSECGSIIDLNQAFNFSEYIDFFNNLNEENFKFIYELNGKFMSEKFMQVLLSK